MRLTPPVREISGDMELVDRDPWLNNLPITIVVKTVKAARSEFGDARPDLARDNRLGIIRHRAQLTAMRIADAPKKIAAGAGRNNTNALAARAGAVDWAKFICASVPLTTAKRVE